MGLGFYMGSFNEVCALSGINIGVGTKVKQLFLTQNPYRDGRGCYPTNQWFVRTPPISGVYDDYGQVAFNEGPITNLICEVFQDDVVEKPFGFNQYHDPDVTKTKGIHHFLNCAWEGRLFVKDDFRCHHRKLPDSFPTWQKIHDIIRKNKLPVQSDSERNEGCEGYNSQPIYPGIVCVHFNSYDNTTKKMKKLQKILEQTYDCKLVYQFEDRKDDACIIVAPKGAFKNPALLFDAEFVEHKLKEHPETSRHYDAGRQLQVLAVMIREDVWQAYCNVNADASRMFHVEEPSTVQPIFDKLKTICAKYKKLEESDELWRISELDFRQVLTDLPLATVPKTHIIKALQKDFPMDDILQGCAELARVEYVMGWLHHSWYIPQLGGQDGSWELRTDLFKKLTAVCQKELDEYNNDVE